MPVVAVPDDNIFARIERSGRLMEAASHGDNPEPLVLKAGVVVVGTGAGGSVVGKELAEAGFDVLMVEAGRFWRPHTDFNQREETMNPALLYNLGARPTRDFSLLITHGKGVGGSTVHNICLSVEPPKAIVERWQREFGFPWSREEIQPYVDRVKLHLGINPVHIDQLNANNLTLKRGADALGWRGFVPHHNRLGCLECGFCEVGCAFNRKQSALVTYIPQAMWAGARLLADTRIDRILHDGTRVLGVEGVMLHEGRVLRPVRIEARTVVASGGAILTPALLRRSKVPDEHKLIGRTFRTHPAVPVGAFFDATIDGWKGIPQTYMVDQFTDFEKDGYGGFMIFPVFGHPGQTGSMVPGLGAEYMERMGRYRNLVAVAPMIHDETMGEVDAADDGEAVVDYRLELRDSQELVRGVQASVELLLAAGAKEVFVPYLDRPLIARSKADLAEIARRGIPTNGIALNAVHPMGSVRWANDPRKGPVRFSGEVRGMQNLFVADASLFPTSIGTAPTVSIMTMATLVASYMIGERSRLE